MGVITYIVIEIAIVLVANVLGWALTEVRRPVFDVKPFNCRPCLTFWLTLFTGIAFAWYMADGWPLYALAAAGAFFNFVLINSKINIHE